MEKYTVTIHFPTYDYDLDGEFDSEEEAADAACEAISAWEVGGEVLNMSNPGDYPYDEDDANNITFDINTIYS